MILCRAGGYQYADPADVKLPRFLRGLEMGVDADSTVHEHVSTLLTDQRIKDINSILAMFPQNVASRRECSYWTKKQA